MSATTRAARLWLEGRPRAKSVEVRIIDIDSGIALGRRTGVSHYVADAAEVTVANDTTLAVRWLCGGSTIDAELVSDEAQPACLGCRLSAAIPAGPIVYFAWDEDGELLYVGSSIQGAVRIRQHMSSTPWWDGVRRLSFETYESEGEARRAEMVAIGKRPGIHNSDGRRRPATVLPFVIDGGVA